MCGIAGYIGKSPPEPKDLKQASEVLKSILNSKNDLTSQILIFDALKTEFRKLKISINKKCINKC